MKAASSDAVFFGAPTKMPFAALHRLAKDILLGALGFGDSQAVNLPSNLVFTETSFHVQFR
jgi:hypothetical protein